MCICIYVGACTCLEYVPRNDSTGSLDQMAEGPKCARWRIHLGTLVVLATKPLNLIDQVVHPQLQGGWWAPA